MKNLIVVFMLVSIVACTSDMESVVKAGLKDPNSVEFGQITVIKDRYACVTFNAKNSFGAYTGDKQAILVKYSNWDMFYITDISHVECIDVIRGLS